MFFILSKIFTFLQSPFSWIFILGVISIVLKNGKWKKSLIYTAAGFFVFFGNEVLIDRIVRSWEIPPVYLKDLKPNYPLGVILCGVTSPGSQPDDRINILSSPDRVLHPVMLYRKGYINKILISGGSGKLLGAKKSEAAELKELLMLCGIPDSALITEEISRNTHENAAYSSEIIKKMGIGNNFLLITSAFHMRRSMACFAKYDLQPQPFSVNAHSHKDTPMDIEKLIFPNAFAYIKWYMIIHECIGYVSYKVSGYI